MVNEMNQKLNKMDWEQFKGSDIFTQMYQDVEQLSGRAIDKLITQLTELREKMQATNDVDYKAVREVTKYIEKLKDTKATISPFSELSKSLKEVNRLRKEGKTLESEQLNLIQQNNEIKAADDDITKYETIIGLKEKINKKEIDETDLTKEQRDLLKQELPILESFLASAKERKKQAQENANASQDNIDIYEKALRETQAAQNQMTQLQQYAESITNSLIEGMDAFGVGIDESTSQLIKTFVNAIFQAIALDLQLKALELQAKKMGVAFNSALGVIGWIAIALEAVVSVFTALFNASDKKKEKAITKLQQKVEDLARAYDKLGEAMQKAFAFDDYEIGYTKSIDNIEEQIADYKKMIALEQSKKKTDDDKVREYQQAIEDLEDDLAELKETRITDLGGFGESNYEDIAEDFVSTWLDAFKETGDGLDDLNDKWDEYVENLFVKQAAYKRAGQLYQKAMDIIDNAIDNGVSGEDLQSYIELAKEAAQQANIDLNDYLKQLAEIFGISQEGENTLSDLQQGISNITEEQAAAVEAYLNSIRFYVASQDSKLSELVAAIREQYSTDTNPMLSVVKEIRDTLKGFAELFEKTVKRDGSTYRIQVV
jgi:hypothetical protein